VEIKRGKPRVYGVSGNNKEEIDCLPISRDLLNIRDERRYLKFPSAVNSSWSHRYLNDAGRWRDLDFKTVAWEKISTPKGEIGAFKIKAVRPGRPPSRVYNYSPKAKAIVVFKRNTTGINRTVTLVDFNVSQ